MIYRPTCDYPDRRPIALAIYCSVITVLMIATGTSFANEQLSAGSSSKSLRNQTVSSLPYQQLNKQTKEKISDVLNKPSIYRRLPITAINADPDYFRFLIRYPEVIVNIWQLMGVTQMETERTGPYSIDTNDGAGTISSLELVYGSENLHIFYGTGTYEGPVFKRKLRGRAVLVLRSENKLGANGKPVATSQLDVFLKVENATAGLIAKTIQPLVGTTADHNFVESLKFVQRLNETTSKNGPGVQQMGAKLDIDEAVRQRFNEVVDVVFQRAINASAPPGGRGSLQPASIEPDRSTAAPTNFSSQQYSASKPQFSTPQPPRVLDQRTGQPASNHQVPVYERLNDFGQVAPGKIPQRLPAAYSSGTPQYETPDGQIHQSTTGYQLPARGYYAPSYASPNAGYPADYQNQQQYGQPVRASYDYAQPRPIEVQPAGGWRPRQ